MGLFSGKKMIVVQTATQRVIEDKFLPNAAKTGAIRGIIQGEGGQIPEAIMGEMLSSIGNKVTGYYNYGRDTYLFGLPKSTLIDSSTNEDVVRGIVSDYVGMEVQFLYYHVGAPNLFHTVWTELARLYNYNGLSNELKGLSAQKGTPVYLWDFQVVLAASSPAEYSPLSLEQWGVSPASRYAPGRGRVGYVIPRPFQLHRLDPLASEDHALVTIRYGGSSEVLRINLGFLDFTKDTFQAMYYAEHKEEDRDTSWMVPDVTGHWSYVAGQGTHPVIDAFFTHEYDGVGSFYPWAYFRYNKTDCLDSPASTEFKQTKKLLKYLKMDFETLTKAIKQNPDIEDVDSAFLMLGVPANSTDPLDVRYLFDFFRTLYFKTGGTPFSESLYGDTLARNLYGPSKRVGMIIQDARFKMSLTMHSLRRFTRVGKLGPRGSHHVEHTHTYVMYMMEHKEHGDGGGTYDQLESFKVLRSSYRKQISETLYEEIQVDDLEVAYHIWGNYHAAFHEESKNLLVPLDHTISAKYAAQDRETLYSRALHYVFNTKQIIKIKWYQTSLFQFLVIVVMIIITIWTGGASSEALAAAIAEAGTAGAAAMILLEAFIIDFALPALVMAGISKVLVKLFGAKFALIIAVVAACYSLGASGLNGGSIETTPWATELLQISNGLIKEVGVTIEEETLALKEDYADFLAMNDARTKELETIQDSLQQQTILCPFVIFGEACEDYYSRTIHAGNVGALSFDMLTNYCDIALRLPKISQTIGDITTPDELISPMMG